MPLTTGGYRHSRTPEASQVGAALGARSPFAHMLNGALHSAECRLRPLEREAWPPRARRTQAGAKRLLSHCRRRVIPVTQAAVWHTRRLW